MTQSNIKSISDEFSKKDFDEIWSIARARLHKGSKTHNGRVKAIIELSDYLQFLQVLGLQRQI